jgi:3-oxoacyl-[acyl-carrier-protein] synthase II
MASPVLNLDNPAPLAEGLDLTRGIPRARAMLNAFGGVNASLMLKRYEDKVAASNLSTDPDT